MKLSIIGLGQAGCNIADAFYEVNDYAASLFGRRLEILTDAFAINTDEADMSGFKHIPKDKGHRIIVGRLSTFGHGVGKINTDAAEIVKASNLAITDTILRSVKFHESDAIMVIASGGGGTGSGMIGWTIKSLKERINKPVYAIIALPFAFEMKGETSFAVMNTATCINTVRKYADAIFLVDNERFRNASSNLTRTFEEMNKQIAESFYDLSCAGEERSGKFIGGKVMDAGDIRQSLEGFTSVGKGQVELPTLRLDKQSFHESSRGQSSIFEALGLAQANFSLGIHLEDARRILVLVSAPRDTISVNVIEEITNFLQNKSPSSIIRIGDYPRRHSSIVVSLVSSELTRITGLEALMLQASDLFKRREEIKLDTEIKMGRLHAFSANLPTLD
jgi:tubulin-like protein CetZ